MAKARFEHGLLLLLMLRLVAMIWRVEIGVNDLARLVIDV
jgi:hypothetical protein